MNLGTDLDGAGAPVPPPSAPRRRRTLIAVIAIVAVAASAIVALIGFSTPAKTVERYLTALLERDVAAALDQVDPGTIPDNEERSTFLNEAAMRTDWSFGAIDTVSSGSGLHREKVAVELSGFGQTSRAEFSVDDIDGTWKIANPFAKVSFRFSSLTFLDVDGVHLTDSRPEVVAPRPEFPVFPGTHRFFADLPEGVALSSPEDYDMLLLPQPTDGEYEAAAPVPEMTLGGELEDQAQQHIREIIDVCAASSKTLPVVHGGNDFTQYCPFGVIRESLLEDGTITYTEGPVEWSVTEYPVFTLVDPPKTRYSDQSLFNGFQAMVEEPGTVSAVMLVDVYDENLFIPEKFTAVIECEFAPDGFRGRLTEDGTLPMYFLAPVSKSLGETAVGLDVDGCTHSLEAR